MNSSIVSEDGKLSLDFQHASDYIVVFSDAEGEVEFVDAASKQEDKNDAANNEATNDDSTNNDSTLSNEEQQNSEDGSNTMIIPIVIGKAE